jgi:hypothetical protein
VQRHADGQRRDRHADRAAAAREVDHGRSPGAARGRQRGRAAGEQLGAPARYEDARIDRHPQPAELDPAEDVLQRQPRHPPPHHARERVRRGGRVDEQPRLVLGEHAARGAQLSDDRVVVHVRVDGRQRIARSTPIPVS